jgi:hypothetical protein
MGRLFYLFAIAAFLLAHTAQAAVSVRSSLNRETILAGESCTLQVLVEGGTPQATENFPPIAGLSIQYQGHQQQYSMVNGVTSFKHVLSYAVTATRPGQYQIPSIRITVDGAQHATQPLILNVAKGDVAAQNREAFVRLIVPKTNIYVGEIIPIEVQLYVTSGNNLQAPKLNSDGFIIHKQAQHTATQTQIGQVNYNVVSFKMSVSAAKAGKLALGPAELSFDLLVRGPRDPNDVFGFFNRVQRRPTTVPSPVVEMNVEPLPPNAPPEFTGAIGAFNWTVDANPKTLNAGDPITLRVVVSGKGNLDNLKLPEFTWPDFKTYAPNSSIEPQDALGLEGTKSFEQVVVPQSGTVRELPALTLAYFDPAQKSYVKLSQPAMPLTVKAASPTAVPTIARTETEAEEQPQERTDIVHIKMETGPLASVASPMVNRPWFWLFQLVPVLAYAGVTIWRKRQDALANNPRLRRKLQVQKTVQSGLVELRQLASANNTNEFYALVFHLLQEQLGERLNLPASAITEAAADERLSKRGASPALLEQLHSLFRLCNQARYAPVQTNDELLAIVSDLEKALVELQALPE